ncbi:hypothetical protein HanPI659440_Chr01g0023371 [Helianthus annuus]|nr:hypothetical protein HanPI659440_Chr01g0023371 [Helianthus annuus]
MFERAQVLKGEKKDLEDRLKSSQSIVAQLQCRVINAERLLLEKGHMEMVMKDKEKAWKEERARLLQEQRRLNRDVKHYQTAASVASQDVETLYAELGIVQDTNQKLASERH